MIVLGQSYSTKELASLIEISYNQFRKNRERYEKHLELFYDYTISHKGNAVYYTFNDQYGDFIPYREYNKVKRKELFQNKIKATIYIDNRQTGSNIARIIYVEKEIQALNLELSTVTNHVRANLKELIEQGYYIKTDYRWCFLDPMANAYILMTDVQVKELREMFAMKEGEEYAEAVLADFSEGQVSKEEACQKIGSDKIKRYNMGITKYSNKYGVRPIKVPVYERKAW